MQRLEELTNKTLLIHEGRRQILTDDGDMVLSYAKSILRMHDELLQRLASPDVEGTVVLGTPDLYAAFVLPAILNRFRKAFPRMQVELRCELSTPLVGLVRRGEIDLALVTRMEGFSGGKVVGQEQLIWMAGTDSDAHCLDPVPLAVAAARQHLSRTRDRQAGAHRTQLENRLHQRQRRRPAGRRRRRHGGHRAADAAR